VKNKVEKWVKDLELLSELAIEEPQCALSAFSKALCHRWAYVQRTIPDIKDLFVPLERCIQEKFIPALVGRRVSPLYRRMFALPVRYGGLGIVNPVEAADRDFQMSVNVTEDLADLIFNQETSLKKLDKEKVDAKLQAHKLAKDKKLKEEVEDLKTKLDESTKESLELIQEQGSGAWLTALPLRSLGYSYNKVEFKDCVHLRYGWEIPGTPTFCACKERNSLNHMQNCKRGGYTQFRHDNVRNSIAEYLREVTKDVRIEPALIPIESSRYQQKGNNADKARLDVSCRGLWSTFEVTYGDVRIFNPRSDSYKDKTLPQLYKLHENEKKRQYMNRVLQVEKGSFTPLVFTTTGGMAPESTRFIKRIAEKLSQKTKESYSRIMNNIRTRLSFDIMRSVLVAIRGSRGKTNERTDPLSSVSFNLVPEARSYEMP